MHFSAHPKDFLQRSASWSHLCGCKVAWTWSDIYFDEGSSKDAISTTEPCSMLFRSSMRGSTSATETCHHVSFNLLSARFFDDTVVKLYWLEHTYRRCTCQSDLSLWLLPFYLLKKGTLWSQSSLSLSLWGIIDESQTEVRRTFTGSKLTVHYNDVDSKSSVSQWCSQSPEKSLIHGK